MRVHTHTYTGKGEGVGGRVKHMHMHTDVNYHTGLCVLVPPDLYSRCFICIQGNGTAPGLGSSVSLSLSVWALFGIRCCCCCIHFGYRFGFWFQICFFRLSLLRIWRGMQRTHSATCSCLQSNKYLRVFMFLVAGSCHIPHRTEVCDAAAAAAVLCIAWGRCCNSKNSSETMALPQNEHAQFNFFARLSPKKAACS